jgi:hypothetical protein
VLKVEAKEQAAKKKKERKKERKKKKENLHIAYDFLVVCRDYLSTLKIEAVIPTKFR